jgi:hypothetical protein
LLIDAIPAAFPEAIDGIAEVGLIPEKCRSTCAGRFNFDRLIRNE